MNPKKQNLLLFEVGMYSELLLQKLDELNVSSTIAIDIKQKTNQFIKTLEPMVEEIYKNSIYSKNAIMQEGTKKTETVAKKIYEEWLEKIQN